MSLIIAAATPPSGTSPFTFFFKKKNLITTSSLSIGVVRPKSNVSQIPSNFVKPSPGPLDLDVMEPGTVPLGVSMSAL